MSEQRQQDNTMSSNHEQKKRGRLGPKSKNADEPNNELNLEDYHFSEFFPREELQTHRAAARRRSSGSLSASADIVAAAEGGNLSHASAMDFDPDLAGADASAAPFNDYNSQGSLDFMDRLNTSMDVDLRKGDRSSSISHLHKQSGGLTASRRELHLSDSDTLAASTTPSGTPGGTSSSSQKDDDRKQPPPPPASQAIASADSRRITRRGRSRPSSGVFEVADSTDDDASARKKDHKGDDSRRRVSDFSLASMMLLMPNMDDSPTKGGKRGQKQQQQQDANEGSEQRPRGRDRTSRSRRAWRSTDELADDSSLSDKGGFEAKNGNNPSPSSPATGPSLDIGVNDVTDRWNQVARSSEQQWTEQSFRYKKSRSLSPYSRGIVGNLPPGNLDPNESTRVSIRSELSDNDTSTLRSSDETGRDSNSNSKRGGSKTKKKPNDTKIHPHHQGGLQGLWLVLPKRLRKRESGSTRARDSKAKGNDDDASLSPVEAQESGATDLEWGSLFPGGLHRSKSKREILREKAELNASKASLTGQGKLGDQMVMRREIKRRKFILRCCLVLIGLVLVLVIPLLVSVPGLQDLLPPRVAEMMHSLMHRLQCRFLCI